MKRHIYNKEELQSIVEQSSSLADVCRAIGLKAMGSNYDTVRNLLYNHNIDCSHFTGSAWNVGDNYRSTSDIKHDVQSYLGNITDVKPSKLLRSIIEKGIKQNICEKCGIGDIWQEQPITLELHHIDGNGYNNALENLQILCPNCHSQTPNHRKPKNGTNGKLKGVHSKRYKQTCLYCGKEFNADRESTKLCSRMCYTNYIRENGSMNDSYIDKSIPKRDDIVDALIKYGNTKRAAFIFNVTDKTLKKYMDTLNITEYYNKLKGFKKSLPNTITIEDFDIK